LIAIIAGATWFFTFIQPLARPERQGRSQHSALASSKKAGPQTCQTAERRGITVQAFNLSDGQRSRLMVQNDVWRNYSL